MSRLVSVAPVRLHAALRRREGDGEGPSKKEGKKVEGRKEEEMNGFTSPRKKVFLVFFQLFFNLLLF